MNQATGKIEKYDLDVRPGGREHEHLPDWAGSRSCLMVAVAAVLLIVYALQEYGVDRRWLQHVPPVKAHPPPHCP